MLLKAARGCVGFPFGFVGGFFVLREEPFVEAPSAGEARVLPFALGVPAPLGAAAGVEEGIVSAVANVGSVEDWY